MGVSFRRQSKQQKMTEDQVKSKRSPADDLVCNSTVSPSTPKHVVIVMDGMEQFSTEPLEWALDNVITAGCHVTLLGIMPWLNIPLWSKIWQDVWPVRIDESSTLKEELKTDIKYLKLQAVINLCRQYGVVLQKKLIMGYPLRPLVAEHIIRLNPTWVVFDRYQKRDTNYYAKKVPYNMVMMNEDGGVDMVRGRTVIDSDESTPRESPASCVPTRSLMISEKWKNKFFKRAE